MKEIRFFDPIPPAKPAILDWPGNVWRLLKALFGVRAFEVPITGKVVADDFRARLPRFDKILNANSLYQVAHDYFDLTGRALEITVPNPPQVMHWTYPLPVKVKGAKNIYTLHDLVPLRLPHTTLDRKRRYLNLMRLLAREADHLVTVSEASRRDIIDLLGVAEDRVTNTYPATVWLNPVPEKYWSYTSSVQLVHVPSSAASANVPSLRRRRAVCSIRATPRTRTCSSSSSAPRSSAR